MLKKKARTQRLNWKQLNSKQHDNIRKYYYGDFGESASGSEIQN
jgi:hypothetical protein